MNDFLMRLAGRPLPVFEGENGGAGVAGAGAGSEGAAGAAGGGAEVWKPPEGLPADYVGKDANETLGKLLPAFTEANTRAEGLRADLAKRPSAPKSADEYKIVPDEKIAPWLGDVGKNPGIKAAREAALKLGISNDQLNGLINGVYGPLADAGQLLPVLDQKAELKSYTKHAGVDAKTAEADFAANEQFTKGLIGQLSLPDDPNIKLEVEAIFGMMQDTAAGNLALRALAKRMSESGITIGGEGAGASEDIIPEADMQKFASDARINPKNRDHPDENKRFDPAMRDRYERSGRYWASKQPQN